MANVAHPQTAQQTAADHRQAARARMVRSGNLTARYFTDPVDPNFPDVMGQRQRHDRGLFWMFGYVLQRIRSGSR